MKVFIFIALFIFSCNTAEPEPAKSKVGSTDVSRLTVSGHVVKIEELNETRFKIITVLAKNYPAANFKAGDTLDLYPNFLRTEGVGINLENAENKKMDALRLLKTGAIITAKITLNGVGKKRHGLIMGWEKEQ